MFGECHMHIFMNARNYREAVQLHKNGVQDADIRSKLKQYQAKGITFLRDGGDHLGVSERTREIAPEYGITYRTPLFAIHKKGHYGGIVGRGFTDLREYHGLVKEVKQRNGDFIKVMFSGIMDFDHHGAVTEPPLTQQEIAEMIHIAHEEGFAVMAHVNGDRAVRAAVEAGVDSVEHGNFLSEETLQILAESSTVWVPTFVTITNLIGTGRFDDTAIRALKEEQGKRIRRGFELGARIALGSDAGAFHVEHGQGLLDEYRELAALVGVPIGGGAEEKWCRENKSVLLNRQALDERLQASEDEIRHRFCRS